MASVYKINHRGKEIICVDLAGLQVSDKPELSKVIDQAREDVSKHPPKSLLIITNVSRTGFDTEIAAIIGEYASHNTPYVKASAIVGISGVQKIVLAAIKTFTGRDFYLADTLEEAQEWLVKQ